MYVEFLKSLLTYVEALNKATDDIDSNLSAELVCYVNNVPVLMEDELCGFIVDEIGGTYSYRDATGPDREWWAKRPWVRS